MKVGLAELAPLDRLLVVLRLDLSICPVRLSGLRCHVVLGLAVGPGRLKRGPATGKPP